MYLSNRNPICNANTNIEKFIKKTNQVLQIVEKTIFAGENDSLMIEFSLD